MSATQIDAPPVSPAPPQGTTSPPGARDLGQPGNPLGHLSPEQIEQLGREFDAIHEEVYGDLGARDAQYIRSVIALHRGVALAGRALLLGSRRRPLWLLGPAPLSLAKIHVNMVVGQIVMHGQGAWLY